MHQSQSEPSFVELLFWILGSFFRNIWKIALFTLIVTSVTLGVVFTLKKTYISEAVLFVPNDNENSSLKNALKDMGGLGDLVGLGGGLSSSPGTDLMMTILKSKQFHDKLIQEFDLLKEYEIKTTNKAWQAQAYKATTQNLVYELTDEGALYIGFKDSSATKAQAITSRIVQMLDSSYSYILRERNSEGRLFYESRLNDINIKLKNAQKALNDFQGQNNILDPETQIASALKSSADLEARAMSIRIEKQVQTSIKGENSEDLSQYDTALKSTQSEIDRITSGKVRGLELGGKKGISKLSTYYALYREYKIQDALYKLVRQKYEEKLMDENRNLRNLVIVQAPWVNEKKVSPPRASIVICAFMLSIILGLLYFAIKENLLRSSTANARLNLAINDFKNSLPKFPKKQ